MGNVEYQFRLGRLATVMGRLVVTGGLLVSAALQGGCLTGTAGNQRLARYRPEVKPYRPETPKPVKPMVPPPVRPTAAALRQSGPGSSGLTGRQSPASPAMPVVAPSKVASSPEEGRVPAATPTPAGDSDGEQPAVAGARRPVVTGQRLKVGDEVVLSLLGVMDTEVTKDVIDERGEVNLKWIGPVKIAGKSTSEAENLIEQLYLDGGYYSKLTVSIVAQKEEYFVQGEVQRQGKFQLDKELTLSQAISVAGGFTPFAKRSKVEIRRGEGQKGIIYDWERIAQGKDADPQIRPGDIIYVNRKVFW